MTNSPQGALIAACALGALMLALILWRTSQDARARAQEKARAWSEINQPEWEARAERKRAHRASGARTRARIRGALMIAVAVVALGATNLSAHGTITTIRFAGLHSLDAAISVIVVFEMFLAILGALSYWHMHHGAGFNKYELGVWLMASLMGGMSWWGAGSAIYALWPILAAIAWHLVITFGRAHKTSALVVWWRMKRGNATSRDATSILTERLITRIVNHAYYANTRKRAIMRAYHDRAFDRAWARADALGILTPEVRARIQTRIAARYAGARALAPEAVAHMNPWNERASMSARSNARAVRPVSAPPAHALDVSAHVPDDARSLTDERASVSAHEEIVIAHADERVIDAIVRNFKATPKVVEWAKAYYETNKELPTRNQVAAVAELSPGHCARWLTNTRKELGLS